MLFHLAQHTVPQTYIWRLIPEMTLLPLLHFSISFPAPNVDSFSQTFHRADVLEKEWVLFEGAHGFLSKIGIESELIIW